MRVNRESGMKNRAQEHESTGAPPIKTFEGRQEHKSTPDKNIRGQAGAQEFLRGGAVMSYALMTCVLMAGFGCESPSPAGKPTVYEQVQQLRGQKAELESQLEKTQTENERLRKQLDALSNLPGDKRAELIYRVQAVKIGRYTNLYDKDKNGTKEELIVYVQPIDETGDAIKAAGKIEAQLWDLGKESDKALIGQWSFEADELKRHWFDSIAMTGYRLMFDVSGKLERFDRPLTIKVTFTDYLSGGTFTEQKVIKP
jgi:hypothetical protein